MDWAFHAALGAFAYLFANWLHSIDIRTVGSGNVRTVNTFRNVGVALGLAVLVVNSLKVATAQPGTQIAPCLLLSFLVIGVYFPRTREHYQGALRERR